MGLGGSQCKTGVLLNVIILKLLQRAVLNTDLLRTKDLCGRLPPLKTHLCFPTLNMCSKCSRENTWFVQPLNKDFKFLSTSIFNTVNILDVLN